MIDMVQNAKDLIQKGKDINDSELIQMGMELLKQYKLPDTTIEQYACQNCGHIMPADKPRKRCPVCKKHKLKIQELAKPSNNIEQFNTQIRNTKKSRIHYDDNGKPDGVIRKIEQIDTDSITNMWTDTGEDKDDTLNESLKTITKISERTRKPTVFVNAVCSNCSKTELVHPIHASGKSSYMCEKCVRRRSPH